MSTATMAKCTFFYEQGQHGWSETYYTNKIISDAYDACIPLGNALIAMRGKNTAITALRISLVNVPTNQGPNNRVAQLFPPLATWASGGAAITQALGPISDTFSASILARCVPVSPVPGVKSIYMGGMPDAYDQSGGQLLGSFTFMYGTDPIKTLQGALVDGSFGWIGITSSPAQLTTPIVAVAAAAGTGQFIMTINRNIFAGSTNIIGNGYCYVPISIRGITTPGNLNGVWPVSVTQNQDGNYNLTLKKRVASLTWSGDGQVTYSPKNFIAFANAVVGRASQRTSQLATYPQGCVYAAKIAKRKRGLPFGLARGKLRRLPTF